MRFNPLLNGTAQAWDITRKPHKGGGGGGGGGTSTTVQSIPDELKPLATAYTGKAIDLGEQAYNPFQGQRYADLNPTQNVGIGMVQNRALSGSPTIANAENNLNQMISGTSNPYLDQMYDRAAGKVSTSINSQFNKPGAFGNTAHQQVLADSLGGMATDLYGGAYAQDRSNQIQAIGMAPQFGNQAYQDASQLLNVGQIQQDQAQNPLDFAYQQYQEQENLPYKQLAAMSGVFGSNLGSSSTTQSNQQSSGGGK